MDSQLAPSRRARVITNTRMGLHGIISGVKDIICNLMCFDVLEGLVWALCCSLGRELLDKDILKAKKKTEGNRHSMVLMGVYLY